MIEQVGQPLHFTGWFRDGDGAALPGLTVTVDVRKPDGTLAVNNAAATDLGSGRYGYDLAGVTNNAVGRWGALFKTSNINASWLAFPDEIAVGAVWAERLDIALSAILAEIETGGDIDGFTRDEAIKLILAELVGPVSGAETTTPEVRAADDSKLRVSMTVDNFGNRSNITLDAT